MTTLTADKLSSINMKSKKKKLLVGEMIERKRIERLIYASFITGFIACHEKRTIEDKDNFEEIKRLVTLIYKDI